MYQKSVTIISALIISSTTAFELSSRPADMRATICSDQMGACTTFCAFKVDKNECNSDSMAWQCVCAGGKVPSDTEINFPVPFYTCQGNQQECAENCSKNSPGDQPCVDRCNQQFKCSNLDMSKFNGTAPPPIKKKVGGQLDDDDSMGSTQVISVVSVVAGICAALF